MAIVRPVHVVSSLLVGAFLCASSAALAQGAPPTTAAKAGRAVASVTQVDGHDVHDFPDDSLLGDGLDGSLIRIPTRSQAVRATLVRPRLSFVPELLSTAEGL
jgi:hypothetical protein